MKLDIQLGKYPLWIVWNKASSSKAALDISLGNRSKEGLAKGIEELELAYIVDIYIIIIPTPICPRARRSFYS